MVVGCRCGHSQRHRVDVICLWLPNLQRRAHQCTIAGSRVPMTSRLVFAFDPRLRGSPRHAGYGRRWVDFVHCVCVLGVNEAPTVLSLRRWLAEMPWCVLATKLCGRCHLTMMDMWRRLRTFTGVGCRWYRRCGSVLVVCRL
ncbi:uncharacterized protein SCHCODRAFT_01313042 [Schizophyllum commune H4-8]|uniref:uncharacterized protein n=1 Tax=Schizophyllum commune (strain H4-8 / FGSC 9210) TaxID=578458 RepID=UPI00215EC26E|nr:uncharacterized protein SCHCODRAFT_01313042 [Schizophyllum commune H4-8]KAI5891782.1 hypothetical protein SCHCODRAFT_01313042 [Schizophyllum commune H4-8]